MSVVQTYNRYTSYRLPPRRTGSPLRQVPTETLYSSQWRHPKDLSNRNFCEVHRSRIPSRQSRGGTHPARPPAIVHNQSFVPFRHPSEIFGCLKVKRSFSSSTLAAEHLRSPSVKSREGAENCGASSAVIMEFHALALRRDHRVQQDTR
ncbi:hypothetical protein SDC9_81314 [bioreactor metagenome]|uniref:Uncharacterized protein n=1 Tax=bioreactor metagenome TaxID=1076179 RepID=A0A644Z293_9ZZZZ